MNIKIHRGLEQIGGCITEISTATTRIFIDFGQKLPGYGEQTTPEQDEEMVREILAHNTREHEAVFYTHAHEDHVGLFRYFPDSVEQYIGEGALLTLQTKYRVINDGDDLGHKDPTLTLQALKKLSKFKYWSKPAPHCRPAAIKFGDIKVTPFLCSHSIYDCYMFLIEADGKRVWHTGDYRAHGYLGKGLLPTLKCYARNIDVLVTEGTMLSHEDIRCVHESKIARQMAKQMKNYDYVFVLSSATDIDRLATIKNASAYAGKRMLICGKFQYEMMKLFSKREATISHGLYLFKPEYYKSKGLKYWKEKGFVLLVGASHFDRTKEIYDNLDPTKCLLIYSSWDGYYKLPEQIEINDSYKKIRELFTNCIDIHTPGHADRKTIEAVIQTVNPKESIIAIHKEEGQSLDSLNLSAELKSKILTFKQFDL